MNEKQKGAYVAPTIEVIEMEYEGCIMSGSATGSLGGFDVENFPTSTTRSTRSYGSASSSDLEDMINDILTIEN